MQSSGGVFKFTDLTMQDIRTFLKDFESKFKFDQYCTTSLLAKV